MFPESSQAVGLNCSWHAAQASKGNFRTKPTEQVAAPPGILKLSYLFGRLGELQFELLPRAGHPRDAVTRTRRRIRLLQLALQLHDFLISAAVRRLHCVELEAIVIACLQVVHLLG